MVGERFKDAHKRYQMVMADNEKRLFKFTHDIPAEFDTLTLQEPDPAWGPYGKMLSERAAKERQYFNEKINDTDLYVVYQLKEGQKRFRSLVWNCTSGQRMTALKRGLLPSKAFQSSDVLQQIAITARYQKDETFKQLQGINNPRREKKAAALRMRNQLLQVFADIESLRNAYDSMEKPREIHQTVMNNLGKISDSIQSYREDGFSAEKKILGLDEAWLNTEIEKIKKLINDYQSKLTTRFDQCKENEEKQCALLRQVFMPHHYRDDISIISGLLHPAIEAINDFSAHVDNRISPFMRRNRMRFLIEMARAKHQDNKRHPVLHDPALFDFLQGAGAKRPLDLTQFVGGSMNEHDIARFALQLQNLETSPENLPSPNENLIVGFFKRTWHALQQTTYRLIFGIAFKLIAFGFDVAITPLVVIGWAINQLISVCCGKVLFKMPRFPSEVYKAWYDAHDPHNAILRKAINEKNAYSPLKDKEITVQENSSAIRTLLKSAGKVFTWLFAAPMLSIAVNTFQTFLNFKRWWNNYRWDRGVGRRPAPDYTTLLAGLQDTITKEEEKESALLNNIPEIFGYHEPHRSNEARPVTHESVERDHPDDAIYAVGNFGNEIVSAFMYLYRKHPLLANMMSLSVGSGLVGASGIAPAAVKPLLLLIDKWIHQPSAKLFVGEVEGIMEPFSLSKFTAWLIAAKGGILALDALNPGQDSLASELLEAIAENPARLIGIIGLAVGVGYLAANFPAYFPKVGSELANSAKNSIVPEFELGVGGGKLLVLGGILLLDFSNGRADDQRFCDYIAQRKDAIREQLQEALVNNHRNQDNEAENTLEQFIEFLSKPENEKLFQGVIKKMQAAIVDANNHMQNAIQDAAIRQLIAKVQDPNHLDNKTVYLIRDWAMKNFRGTYSEVSSDHGAEYYQSVIAWLDRRAPMAQSKVATAVLVNNTFRFVDAIFSNLSRFLYNGVIGIACLFISLTYLSSDKNRYADRLKENFANWHIPMMRSWNYLMRTSKVGLSSLLKTVDDIGSHMWEFMGLIERSLRVLLNFLCVVSIVPLLFVFAPLSYLTGIDIRQLISVFSKNAALALIAVVIFPVGIYKTLSYAAKKFAEKFHAAQWLADIKGFFNLKHMRWMSTSANLQLATLHANTPVMETIRTELNQENEQNIGQRLQADEIQLDEIQPDVIQDNSQPFLNAYKIFTNGGSCEEGYLSADGSPERSARNSFDSISDVQEGRQNGTIAIIPTTIYSSSRRNSMVSTG